MQDEIKLHANNHGEENKMKLSFKSFLCAGIFTASLTLWNVPQAQASCVQQPYMGTVCWTASFYCPKGYAEANGQLLGITGNEALYSLLGIQYGGDGRTTFGLPDLRGRAAVGTGVGPNMSPVSLGQKIGGEEHRLTIAELPAHTHGVSNLSGPVIGTVVGTDETGDLPNPDGQIVSARPTGGPPAKKKSYYGPAASGTVRMATDSVVLTNVSGAPQTAGAGASTSTQYDLPLRPPQVAVLACIAQEGTYPQRP
jgi:microcystin-dependent protein